jgi:carbamoyltransferase
MPGDMLSAPYMQYTAKCKKPDEFPAIVHADGTSRVQTVNQLDHPELFRLLSRFYDATGCPMIVNTSLNIKGQPIVNTEQEAIDFSKHYGVPVHCRDD